MPETGGPTVAGALLKKKNIACSPSRSMNLLSLDLINDFNAISGDSRRSLPDLNQDLIARQADLTVDTDGDGYDEDEQEEQEEQVAVRSVQPAAGYGQLMTKEKQQQQQDDICCYVNGYKVPRKGFRESDQISSHFALPPLKLNHASNNNNEFEHVLNLRLMTQEVESNQEEEASLC